MTKYFKKPKSLVLQWHINETCNWNCKHCYREKNIDKKETNFSDLKKILDEYINLLDRWGIKREKARINLAGGEPFLDKNFFKLINLFAKNENKFGWSVFSNGSLVNKKNASYLKNKKINTFQISLEGLEKHNNFIRGKGTYKKIINAIKILVNQKIKVRVSLTLTKKNVNDIPLLVKILDELGVSFLNVRRLVPQGTGKQLKKEMLNKKEQFSFYEWCEKENINLKKNNKKLKIITGCDSGIFNNKKTSDSPTVKNFCGIVNGSLMVVMPNGDIMPCRRLPIITGNIFKNTLLDIWSSKKFKNIRDIDNVSKLCKKCKNFETCFGGARCVTYALNKKFTPDILCKTDK
jgi:radical SAM protein with 4Fe4S-binding SPASM domain